MNKQEKTNVPNYPKLTWAELKEILINQGIQDSDEIDRIDISWGRPEDVECKKDKDFGWQVFL